jgi:hypothetical protein
MARNNQAAAEDALRPDVILPRTRKKQPAVQPLKPNRRMPARVAAEELPPNAQMPPEHGEIDHTRPEIRRGPVDLSVLHAVLGHYARQLWDIQKERVAMGNRVFAMKDAGLDAAWVAPMVGAAAALDELEKAINKQLEHLAKQHPLAPWVKKTVGIGYPGFARILGATGPIGNFATVSKLWKFCHPAGEVILTRRGLVPVQNLRVGDQVVDAAGNSTKITKTDSREYTGRLLAIRAVGCLPFTVTEEHPILVARAGRRDWIPAGTVSTGDTLFMPILQSGGAPTELAWNARAAAVRKNSRLASPLPLNAEVLYLMGRFLADGSAHAWTAGGYERGSLAIVDGAEQRADLERLSETIDRYVGEARIVEVANGLSLRFGRLTVAQRFGEWFGRGAINKRIPDFVMNLGDPERVRAFVRGYLFGDGHVVASGKSRGAITASSASRCLIQQIQLLLTKLDVFASIHRQVRAGPCVIAGRETARVDRYVLWVPISESTKIMPEAETKKINRTARRVRRADDGWLVPVTEIEVSPVEDVTVYNITVETGTYLASNLSVHNCGLDVQSGRAPRRQRGVKTTWSPKARVVAYQLADAMVKVGKGPYREAYDRKKGEYLTRERLGPSGCPLSKEHRDAHGNIVPCIRLDEKLGREVSAHVHAAAMRYAVKEMLKDLWVEWRDTIGIRPVAIPEAPPEELAAHAS